MIKNAVKTPITPTKVQFLLADLYAPTAANCVLLPIANSVVIMLIPITTAKTR